MVFKKTKYYDSVDNCPIGVHHNCLTKGELKGLLISGKFKAKAAHENWEKIFDEFIEEWGLPESYKRNVKLRIKINEYWLKVYTEGRRDYITRAKIKEAQLREMQESIAPVKFSTSIAQVSKGMGFRVDPKVTTVREFYGYIDSLNG